MIAEDCDRFPVDHGEGLDVARHLRRCAIQDAVRAPVAVDNASCIEDLWHATIAGLREWLTARGLAEQAKASLKEALKGGADGGGGCSTVEVPVNYGEVPGASDADARERDEGAERPAVDVPTREEWNVDVQWEDMEELWSYDVHPTQGARPASLASTLIMLAHAGANGNSHFIGGSTPWPSLDTGTDALDGGGADTEVQNPNAFSEPETLPRWTGRRKRKRGEDQIDSGKEEQTVAQRLSSHFYHVMMRCGAMKKEGHPMTPADVARELGSPPNHWAGDHSGCGGVGDTPPRCVREGWGKDHAIYEFGSSTHKAVREWFSKHLSPEKVESFVHGASSSLNESFHSLIIKYAPKRIRFQGSFPARVGLAVLHWNHGMDRLVTAYRTRVRQVMRIRRGSKERILTPMDWGWVDRIMGEWQRSLRFGDSVDVEGTPDTSATPAQPVEASIARPTASVLQPETPVRQGGMGRRECGTSRGSARRRLGKQRGRKVNGVIESVHGS
ncbi:unnamed protein product [Closterium sp. Yama58-4]|nr:unnamed protein product [Closterium sp. Yama58-4]